MSLIEVKVPDIGDFRDVDVIEILVKPGERVEKEASLITLESDKATMEIPSSHAGIVRELRVKVGDKMSEGSVVLLLEAGEAAESEKLEAPLPAARAPDLPEPNAPAPAPAAPVGSAGVQIRSAPVDLHAEVVVLGSGPGGYTAAFRAADLGKKVILIERYAALGGVCTNVGCIPSKALLHVAKVITEAQELAASGVSFAKPAIDIDKMRAWKDAVVSKGTMGLAGLARQRKVPVMEGAGKFESPKIIAVQTTNGNSTRVSFDHSPAFLMTIRA